MNGFLLLDKAVGKTSFDLVRDVKRIFKTKKVGHAGTLDPDASGLLLIAVNHATRLLRFLELEPKTYTFEMVLGTKTNTDDAVGEVVLTAPFEHIGRGEIEALLPTFCGEIGQRPPQFSALHVNGKRAYKLARKGEAFELPERSVIVHKFSLLSVEDNRVSMAASVSSGTYIRSLARDLGEALSSVAHASKIRRVSLAQYHVDAAKEIQNVTIADLIPAEDILCQSLPLFEIEEEDLVRIRKGLQFNLWDVRREIGDFLGLCVQKTLVGVGEVIEQDVFDPELGSRIQPRVVFPEEAG